MFSIPFDARRVRRQGPTRGDHDTSALIRADPSQQRRRLRQLRSVHGCRMRMQCRQQRGHPVRDASPLAWRLQQIGRAALDDDWCGTVPKRFPPPYPCQDSIASVRPAGEMTKGRAGVAYAPIGLFA
jgi:hypothetical protein